MACTCAILRVLCHGDESGNIGVFDDEHLIPSCLGRSNEERPAGPHEDGLPTDLCEERNRVRRVDLVCLCSGDGFIGCEVWRRAVIGGVAKSEKVEHPYGPRQALLYERGYGLWCG